MFKIKLIATNLQKSHVTLEKTTTNNSLILAQNTTFAPACFPQEDVSCQEPSVDTTSPWKLPKQEINSTSNHNLSLQFLFYYA